MTATGLTIIACAAIGLAMCGVVRQFTPSDGWPSMGALEPILDLGPWLVWICIGLAGISAVASIVAAVRCRGRFRVAASAGVVTALIVLGQALALWMGWVPARAVLQMIGVGAAG